MSLLIENMIKSNSLPVSARKGNAFENLARWISENNVQKAEYTFTDVRGQVITVVGEVSAIGGTVGISGDSSDGRYCSSLIASADDLIVQGRDDSRGVVLSAINLRAL